MIKKGLAPWQACILVFVCACFSPFAFAPYQYWWLAFFIFTPFLFTFYKQPAIAFKLGFSFGLGWFATGLSWVHVSIAQFGGLPLALSILLIIVLAAYLALYFGFALSLASKIASHFFSKPSLALVFLPLTWFFCEWLRSWVLTGFPWLSVGYSQVDGPLSSLFPLFGEAGASIVFITLICMAIICIDSWRSRNRNKVTYTYTLALVVSLFLFIGVSQLLDWTKPRNDSVKLTLVQGNIEQSVRWSPDNVIPTLIKYQDLSEEHWASSDIVIWPEAAVPLVESYAKSTMFNLDTDVAEQGAALITGLVDYKEKDREYFNNILVLGRKENSDIDGHYFYGHENRYAKYQLLPIGEFVPFESLLRPLAPLFDLPHSSFQRGAYVQPNIRAQGYNIASALCYEIAFPNQLRANLNTNTDFILTLSNDSWFGESIGPFQHFQIARARALEFGLPVVRVTNSGISAVIDEQGQVRHQLPQFKALASQYEMGLSQGETLFRQYGHWPLNALLLLFYSVFIFCFCRLGRCRETVE